MSKIRCVLKKCKRYGHCSHKENPFFYVDGKIRMCEGYHEYSIQDWKLNKSNQFEILFSEIDIDINNIELNSFAEESLIMYESGKTRRNLIIQRYFFDRIEAKNIAKELDCSIQYVYSVIRECRQQLLIEPTLLRKIKLHLNKIKRSNKSK